jgi:hypothetical protein
MYLKYTTDKTKFNKSLKTVVLQISKDKYEGIINDQCEDMWAIYLLDLFTRCTNFSNLFWHETLHVSDSSSAYHQEFIHCSLGTGISMSCMSEDSFRARPGWNCSSILVLHESCLQTCMTYTIAECTVNKLLTMDRGNL